MVPFCDSGHRMMLVLVFVLFLCVICLVIFRQSQNKMQALYMADKRPFCDVYSLSTTEKKNTSPSRLRVCNYNSYVMEKNAVGFYFLFYICFVSFVCFFK